MMSNLTLKKTSYRFLFEQDEEAEEDIFGGGDEEAEGGDEAAAGEGEDAPAEGGEDESPEQPKVSPAEKYELSDSIDAELEALLVDFESEARKSAVVNTPAELGEALRRNLFENTAGDIDLRNFAANVARLVKNYQNLIDWGICHPKQSRFVYQQSLWRRYSKCTL